MSTNLSSDSNSKKIFLKDYEAPLFEVPTVNLSFKLSASATRVTSKVRYQRSQKPSKAVSTDESQKDLVGNLVGDLVLDGVDLDLISIEIDEKNLTEDQYRKESDKLVILNPPDNFTLTITTQINPAGNTSLEGLYQSKGIYCTQCEAQGFRKITYFMDRPDVMSMYTVNIERDPAEAPIALSNGNLIKEETTSAGTLISYWEDPFKKPCYLFALVAGNLGRIEDTFTTRSGRSVLCEVYSEPGKENLCGFALQSLKKAMAWDEERYDLEYDLDRYMIVAIDDFNAGAMENKGLNVFNSRLVFANPEIATDTDYFNIESVIAHEYFHNWTGNRVTLRDWFQLSLKEGLTVFRDQEFSADMTDRTLQRMQDVSGLLSGQFTEDAGPNAHPVRPESCLAVDNFFTMTIYEKGAEVIRMMQTLVGRPGFKAGMAHYFKCFDGMAVTTEDFASAILETNNFSKDLFKEWYQQAGTPEVQIKENWNEQKKELTIQISQSCRPTAENSEKKPFFIPIKYQLLGAEAGEILPQSLPDTFVNTENEKILLLKEAQLQITMTGLNQKPFISWLQDFSAPVNLKVDRAFSESLGLLSLEKNLFNKNRLRLNLLEEIYLKLIESPNDPAAAEQAQMILLDTLNFIQNSNISEQLVAEFLTYPSTQEIIQKLSLIDMKSIERAQNLIAQIEASVFADWYESTYLKLQKLTIENPNDLSAKAQGYRKLKNRCLNRLRKSKLDVAVLHAVKQYDASPNMTDRIAALTVLGNQSDLLVKQQHFDDFINRYKEFSNVLNHYFSIQALSENEDTFSNIKALEFHPEFNVKNPNRVYSLLRNFGGNSKFMWAEDPQPRKYYLKKIQEIDAINPQVAARLCASLSVAPKLNESLRTEFMEDLSILLKTETLSKNSRELLAPLLTTL